MALCRSPWIEEAVLYKQFDCSNVARASQSVFSGKMPELLFKILNRAQQGLRRPQASHFASTRHGRRGRPTYRQDYSISSFTALKAPMAFSKSLRLWAAEICVRMRASPWGTTG